ncbi:hypothetical protein [Roseomonas sp. USHLN139]|uniref:hypothetical protein n=1 Tax=Roseomonas sp. USHLN139 TaxID=3081298 RepID=UPI003B019F0B
MVCGQAQKCVRWRDDAEALFRHLQSRGGKRLARAAPSRFERGEVSALRKLEGRHRSSEREFAAFIVQPGLLRALAEGEHLELLAATETYFGGDVGAAAGRHSQPVMVVGSE